MSDDLSLIKKAVATGFKKSNLESHNDLQKIFVEFYSSVVPLPYTYDRLVSTLKFCLVEIDANLINEGKTPFFCNASEELFNRLAAALAIEIEKVEASPYQV